MPVTDGLTVASPSIRPAVSEDTTTESAPDCRSRCAFSDSLTEATIVALGAISRTDRVISTAVSSWFGATTTAFARVTPASLSTSEDVAGPCTLTSPRDEAWARASASVSMTTIWDGGRPSARRAVVAARPLVPNPTTTVWLRMCFLQRRICRVLRDSSVSTDRVVPTSRIRKMTRIGVMTRTLISRACWVTGAMSP